MEDKFELYLAGCLIAAVLILAKSIIALFISWITKDYIVIKNAKKIQPPDETPFWTKSLKFIMCWLVESALSWVNVAVVAFQIPAMIITTTRNWLAYKPEAVKKVLFPLQNNPHLERETVWANFAAFRALFNGKQHRAEDLLEDLSRVKGIYPSFDPNQALAVLADLKVVDTSVIEKTAKLFNAA